MSDERENLDAAIDRVLEQKREVAVPAAFAGRVMRSLPPQRKRAARIPVARFVALFSVLVLLVTMFALAPQARPNLTNFAFDMELLMLLQLSGIAWWVLGRREV